jgi:hypothetical protein
LKYNWEQIFGTNPWLWPFPIFLGSGKPFGDGIYWQTNTPQEEKDLRSTMSPMKHNHQTVLSPGSNLDAVSNFNYLSSNFPSFLMLNNRWKSGRNDYVDFNLKECKNQQIN